MRRWLSIIIAILLFGFMTPRSASAHPQIVQTEPAANAQLATAPTRVRITFNESVETTFSDVQLFDAQRQRVDHGGGGRDEQDSASLVLPLPPLGPGDFTVVWQTVGSDGHRVKGNFAFTVLGSSEPASAPNGTIVAQPTTTPAVTLPSPSEPTEGDALATLLAALRALMLFGALVIGGGWAALMWVIAPALGEHSAVMNNRLTKRWRWTQWAALALLGGSTVAFALAQTQLLAGQVDLASVRALLAHTRIGQALVARLALTIVLIVALWRGGTLGSWQGWLALMASGGLLLSFSLSSHGAAQPAPLLPILSDWVHLVATTLWVGGLVVVALAITVIRQSLDGAEQAAVLARLIVRFSTLALWSVAALVVSGTYGALLHLHAASDLWTSDYGMALLVKVVLFCGLLALGAYNLFVVRPSFVAWANRTASAVVAKPWPAMFQMTVRSEVVLAILVIGAVGVLTNVAPPSAQKSVAASVPTFTPTPALRATATALPTRTPVPSIPFEETKQVEDVQITLVVTPASVGTNTMRVTVRDANGTPFEAQKVVATLHMLDMDMGTNQADVQSQGAGVYLVPAGHFSMVGSWQVKITVRRADADDVDALFTVPVGG